MPQVHVHQMYPNCAVNVHVFATAQPVVSMQRAPMVNVGRVHVMLNVAMVTAVVQRLNQLGQRGVRLPMIKHVSYGQPLMTLYDDWCVCGGKRHV